MSNYNHQRSQRESRLKLLLLLTLSGLLLISSCTPAMAAPALQGHGAYQVVTETSENTVTLQGTPAAKSETRIVSNESKPISGTATFGREGLFTGGYTGTALIRISERTKRGSSAYTRTTTITTTKKIYPVLSDTAKAKLFKDGDKRLQKALSILPASFAVDTNLPRLDIQYVGRENTFYLGCDISYEQLFWMLGAYVDATSGLGQTKEMGQLLKTEGSSLFGLFAPWGRRSRRQMFYTILYEYQRHPSMLQKRCPKSYAYADQALSALTPQKLTDLKRRLR